MIRLLTPAVLFVAAVALGGCQTSKHSLRADISPELASTASSEDQDDNNYARVIDHNTRDAWEDAKRLLLLERSTMLSPYVIP
jgi:hypothetical protein